MPSRLAPALSALLLLAFAATATAGTTTILDADFDAEPLDALIGIGGAVAGQPVSLGGAPAFVRSAPMGTPSLEIGDDSSVTSESVRFEFLNGWGISSGVLTLSMNLWFHTADDYQIYIREAGTSSVGFLNLRFDQSGVVGYGDLDSGGSTTVGSYTTGSSLPLVLTFDLGSGTYDVTLDGAALLTAESMGTFTEGIGSILIGASFDADLDGLLSVDDVLVTATETPSPVDPSSWTGIKAIWRTE